MTIGVFDSGIGGQSVVNAIKHELPDIKVIFKNDSTHVPYGTRTIDEIYMFCLPILQSLISEGCQVIVIACNTVSTNLIERLRRDLSVPLVAMEPMIKPAAEATKSKVIVCCATPLTLQSQRYKWLKEEFAKDVIVLEPDCSDWSQMIESDTVDRDKITAIIDEAIKVGADQLVLGCTHYHWIEELIREITDGRADVIQPEKPVIEQLKRVLAQLG